MFRRFSSAALLLTSAVVGPAALAQPNYPATVDVFGGEIDFMFATLSTVKPHVEQGRLRALAVTTKKPSRVFPNLPTMDSMYPGFEADNWFGLFVLTAVSKDIITRLHALSIAAAKRSR